MTLTFNINEIIDYALIGMVHQNVLPDRDANWRVYIAINTKNANDIEVKLENVDRTDRKETKG